MMLDAVPWHAPAYYADSAPREAALPPMVKPMPARKHEIAELKAMLSWAKTHRGGANAILKERALQDSLAKAIAFLEETPGNSLDAWIIGAVYQAMVRKGKDWYVVDRKLLNDAMDIVAERFAEKE